MKSLFHNHSVVGANWCPNAKQRQNKPHCKKKKKKNALPTWKNYDGWTLNIFFYLALDKTQCQVFLILYIMSQPGEVDCTTNSSHFPHPGDPTRFIVCENGRKHEMSCPQGLVWNQNAKTCDWPQTKDQNENFPEQPIVIHHKDWHKNTKFQDQQIVTHSQGRDKCFRGICKLT